MLLHLTPHAHLGPALYRLCLICHRGGSRCEGRAVWTFVSAACSRPSGFGAVPVWMARSEPSWLISSWWETLCNVPVHLPILLCVWCVFFFMATSYYVIRLKKKKKKTRTYYLLLANMPMTQFYGFMCPAWCKVSWISLMKLNFNFVLNIYHILLVLLFVNRFAY